MSRPPEPRDARSPGGDQPAAPDRLDYLPLDYAQLLALEEDHAARALGRAAVQTGTGAAEADVTRTMMELSALVGHVLSVYQRRYARESFISTATAPSSLLRHAERLGYQPDPGVGATGHVVLVTKLGVSGTVPARLALASTALGEIRAQDYETLQDIPVDASLNELTPLGSQQPVSPGQREILLQGTGLGLGQGDVAMVPPATAFLVAAVTERADTTVVTADRDLTQLGPPRAGETQVLMARPGRVARSFGTGADPVLFPPEEILAATGSEPISDPRTPTDSVPRRLRPAARIVAQPVPADGYWYTVSKPDGQGYAPQDFFLAEALPASLAGQYVVRRAGHPLVPFLVDGQITATVTLQRRITETFPSQKVTVTPQQDGSFVTSTTATTGTQVTDGHISGTVSALRLMDTSTNLARRQDSPFPSEWLTDWQVQAPLATTAPSTDPVRATFALPGLLPGLTPGRLLAFATLDRSAAQIVSVQRADLDAQANRTTITWDAVSPAPAPGWTWRLGNLLVLGNVAPISHGRTIEEPLGGSDGVSPFQVFTLKQSPITVLPTATGGAPALEVRVGGVLWSPVTDFADSGPEDHRVVAGPDHTTSILFGDGQHGAVPPSGKKNVTAVYRIGLGQVGNVPPQRVTRLKRSHPLLDHVVNLTAVTGGTDPAPLSEVRTVATRWIRTFDRAVSVADVADLALSFPGIARAAASFSITAGITLVVATAAGTGPSSTQPIRAFLDARRDTGIRLRFADPEPLDLHVSLQVTSDPAHLVETVRDAVQAALYGEDAVSPGMFTFAARDLGQPAFSSELYQRIESLPGVIAVQVTELRARSASGVTDQIPADPHQWLRLLPANLATSVVPERRDG
jgi:hypothetical protein